MKLLVCGSRNFFPLSEVVEFFRLLKGEKDVTIITGGAAGVDQTAEIQAEIHGFQCVVMNPDWEQFGKKAGPIRNQLMVEACDQGVAFWDGHSRGTADTIHKLRAAGKSVHVIVRAPAKTE